MRAISVGAGPCALACTKALMIMACGNVPQLPPELRFGSWYGGSCTSVDQRHRRCCLILYGGDPGVSVFDPVEQSNQPRPTQRVFSLDFATSRHSFSVFTCFTSFLDRHRFADQRQQQGWALVLPPLATKHFDSSFRPTHQPKTPFSGR